MIAEVFLRVTAIRSQNPRGFGGCIFTGKLISPSGEDADATSYVVVRATGNVLGGALVQPGQWWQISGDERSYFREVNGYRLTERQLSADAARFVRPSGEHLVQFMADNVAFEGIGQVKARKLWRAFGERLFDILHEGDIDALCKVLTAECAMKATAAWASLGDSRTLQWMQAKGFDIRLGQRVIAYFGEATEAKLTEDPYRLLSFSGSWPTVDQFAQAHFGLPPDDPRRLQGAIEEALYRSFGDGHTSMFRSAIMTRLSALLGAEISQGRWRDLVPAALDVGLSNGSYVTYHKRIQSLGAFVMERQVAQFVSSRVNFGEQYLISKASVDAVLDNHEELEGLSLNQEQRLAVHVASSRALAIITGGAGVGKTTVLKALHRVYVAADFQVVQLALAGRAAKRMQEATGEFALTIASFLKNTPLLSERCVVVVDEASLVDIITMSRLCNCLPSNARLLLVGDPAQLQPVGPGLVLHALMRLSEVPLVELKTVKRYYGEIANAAAEVRIGRWPALTGDEQRPVAFISIQAGSSIAHTVLRLYQEMPGETQILSARRQGPDGVNELNKSCQSALTRHAPPMMVWSAQHDSMILTGYRQGDRVLCTRNLWDRALQNGSLGVLASVTSMEEQLAERDAMEPVLGWIEWDDGELRPVVESMLDDFALGYAITVHKAQGSQWPRVIVSLTGHRLLDRTLVYTAMTRAQRQVLFVGDEIAVQNAVLREPGVNRREVALDLHLSDLFSISRQSDACLTG